MDIQTVITIIAFLIPVTAGLFQYRQAVQQNEDKNFREEIEKLTSKDREERLAAATNIGTFVIKGNRFYEEAIDILVNRTSVELDYNVLGAMVVSLRKVEKEAYRDIIQKLVDIERSFFIQKYPLKKWRDQTSQNLKKVQDEFQTTEENHKVNALEFEKVMLENLKKEMQIKWEDFLLKEKDFNELEMHSQAITDFISSFLGVVSKSYPITGLEFNKNSLSNAIMEDIQLLRANIKASAFSNSQIINTKFDESKIFNTVFTFSLLANSSFRNCKISGALFDYTNLAESDFSGSEVQDIFFLGSDLTGANFKKTKGLRPVHFYLSRHLDKALFDGNMGTEIQQSLAKITEDHFVDYVLRSSLTKQRRDALFVTLDELKAPPPSSPA